MANPSTLTTGTNSGTQTSTQSPQNSAQPTGFSGLSTSSVQPTNSASLLNSSGGIPLQNTQLSTVSLSGNATDTTATKLPTHHAIDPVMFVFAVVLFAIAIYLFWSTSRSAKNTTN